MYDIIEQFENKLLEALEFKYKNEPIQIKDSLIKTNVIRQMDLGKFYKLYLEKEVYPQERLEKLVYQLFDVKIEFFYIVELDLGLYNHLIYNLGFDNSNIGKVPYILLRKLSLDQTIILKSRILWERIMYFIYYLEKGKELNSRSKKTRFFDFIKNTKWLYLMEYKKYVEWFDDKLRTPEVHKSSFLRKQFLIGETLPSHKMLGLINILMNTFWINLLEIIQGNEIHSTFWDIAMDGL